MSPVWAALKQVCFFLLTWCQPGLSSRQVNSLCESIYLSQKSTEWTDHARAGVGAEEQLLL